MTARTYTLIAAISLLFTLFLPYIGEEGVYVTSALEMAHTHHYWINTLYGAFYPRPPLFNWLIIGLSHIIGFKQALISSRLISALSMMGITALVFYLCCRLTNDKHFAWLASAIFLTGDVLIRHGWIAYADPLLSFFVTASISLLWIAIDKKKPFLLLLSITSVFLAFLTKALTPFVIYGLAWLVLYWRHPSRRFLLSPTVIPLYTLLPIALYIFHSHISQQYLPVMWAEMHNTAFAPTLKAYIFQIIITQPLMLIVHLMPFSVLALWQARHTLSHCFKQSYTIFKQAPNGKHALGLTAFFIAFINFLPCWFAPRWPEARYVMPMYPFFAIAMATIISISTPSKRRLTWLFSAMLATKALSVAWFYYFQYHYRPPYKKEAASLLHTVGTLPINIDNLSYNDAPLNSISASAYTLSWPKINIIFRRDKKYFSGFFLSNQVYPDLKKSLTFNTHGQALWLYTHY